MIKRISVAIVLLIKENPVLPLSFKFEGKCMLEQLKAERDEFKAQRDYQKKTGSTGEFTSNKMGRN